MIFGPPAPSGCTNPGLSAGALDKPTGSVFADANKNSATTGASVPPMGDALRPTITYTATKCQVHA
ncbi:MAG: hypothetical protein OJF49_002695 [Ktedonobacterales bacterium]|nr:MAG: hypothetical protein OJF49_002695 [Ktedonobacterales bacterium]